MARLLRCYAEGQGEGWEAFCLDLDIAVQDRSFEEVYRSLGDAIDLYSQSVAALPETDTKRLLFRRAPLGLRLRCLALAVRSLFSDRSRPETLQRAEFTISFAGVI